MKLTKWFIMAAGLSLMVACSDDSAEPAETVDLDETEQQQSDTDAVEEETDETVAEDEAVDEEEPEEEIVVAEPQYKLNPNTWGLEPISDAPAEAVLLTIDDAPDKNAVDMAKTLKELDVPAIFFVNGHFIDTEEEQAKLKEIHDMGFAIGNHTDTHPNLRDVSEEQQREEIVVLNDKIEEIIGERPEFFRAPHGVNTDFSRALVEEEGMLLMNWSYGYDWEQQYMDAGALADIMVNTEFLRNGANLLMHDRDWTAGALPGIVQGLQDKGYTFIDPNEIEGVE